MLAQPEGFDIDRAAPIFVFGALGLRWLWRGLREHDWRIPALSRRFALAFAITIVAGVGVSTAQFGAQAGVAWAEGVVVREPVVRGGLFKD